MLGFSKIKIFFIIFIVAGGLFCAFPNLWVPLSGKALPDWWRPVNLGLDLQGGSHMLLEVNVNNVVAERMAGLLESVRSELRRARIVYRDLGLQGHGATQALTVHIPQAEHRVRAHDILQSLNPQVDAKASADGVFVLTYSARALSELSSAVVAQSIEIVRRRIDAIGTREPSIQRQGNDRIIVEIPGLNDPGRVKRLLGQTAKLTFHLVTTGDIGGQQSCATQVLANADPAATVKRYTVCRKVEVAGDHLTDASVSFQNNSPVVSFRFDAAGGRRFGELTQASVGRQLAIVLDQKVISAPVINEPILGGTGVITGHFTTEEAQDLAVLLRAGALPAALTILEERTVGPQLGADSIRAGAIASVVGIVLVIACMTAVYGMFGLFADIALLVNISLLFGVLSLLGATLTLPGIAGIVLAIGMAVDANVLIFERIREEFKRGHGTKSAVEAGFKNAVAAIIDANVTTLIATLLLFQFGSGPIRGFAVTLSIGVASSMFCAIMLTRLLVMLYVRGSRTRLRYIS